MADEQQTGSTWPEPPAYYRDKRKRKPPPPPAEGVEVQMYGLKRPALGSRPPQAALEEQVYSASNDAEALVELRRLNRSTLSAFRELLRILQEAPTESAPNMAKLRTLLLNMQHLLNSLRPYQAREELIATMTAQVDAKQQLIDELRSAAAACATCGTDAEQEDGDKGGGGSSSAAGPRESASSSKAAAAEDAALPCEAQLRAREQLEQLARTLK